MLRDWLERRAGGPARLYARAASAVDRAGVAGARRAILAEAVSPILEIGPGPGAAFAHYPPGSRVTAVEPEPDFRHAARAHAERSPAEIRVVPGDAHDLPFADGAFATVVVQLTLCSVARPDVALAEAYRVLRPDGRLRLVEHVRHANAWMGRVQDAVDPLWTRVEGRGCHLGRDTPRAVAAVGFAVDDVAAVPLPAGAAWLFPVVVVRAHRPA